MHSSFAPRKKPNNIPYCGWLATGADPLTDASWGKNRNRFLFLSLITTSHKLIEIFLCLNFNQSHMFIKHCSAFIMCHTRSRGRLIYFYLRCRCSRKRIKIDILDLLNSSPSIHLEACQGMLYIGSSLGLRPLLQHLANLLRKLIDHGLDDAVLILRIGIVIRQRRSRLICFCSHQSWQKVCWRRFGSHTSRARSSWGHTQPRYAAE